MKYIKLLQIQLFLSVAVILYACSSNASESTNQCIGSFQKYAYTVPDNGLPYLATDIPPQEPWQYEISLPSIVSEKATANSVAASISLDGNIEVWINSRPYGNAYYLSDDEYYNYLIYQVDTKEWRIVPARVKDSDAFVDRLFIAEDGSIWGRNVWDISSNFTSLPMLSKYNEKTQEFELDQNVREIPALWKDTNPNTIDIPFWTEVLLDSDGVFWLLAHKDAIYSYNPSTQEIERNVDLSEFLVQQAVLAPNETIYFQRYDEKNTGFALHKQKLFQFIPQRKNIQPVEIPDGRWPGFGNILVDSSNRLWLDTVGWREPDGTWHMIYPKPWLYFWKMEWQEDYRWATPHVILESSNGYIWYRTEKGMAWLDPNSMQGCWFTTEDTNIVEDQQHNLWMVADNKLYKYPLNP